MAQSLFVPHRDVSGHRIRQICSSSLSLALLKLMTTETASIQTHCANCQDSVAPIAEWGKRNSGAYGRTVEKLIPPYCLLGRDLNLIFIRRGSNHALETTAYSEVKARGCPVVWVDARAEFLRLRTMRFPRLGTNGGALQRRPRGAQEYFAMSRFRGKCSKEGVNAPPGEQDFISSSDALTSAPNHEREDLLGSRRVHKVISRSHTMMSSLLAINGNRLPRNH